MDEKNQKKPYQSPQITRVLLRREQAILSVCSTSTVSLSTSSASKKCASTCRRTGSGTGTTVAS